MKKFLVIFMGIFMVLAMSTVAFASDYVAVEPPYTLEELEELYGQAPFKSSPYVLTNYYNRNYYAVKVDFQNADSCTYLYELVYDEQNDYYICKLKVKFNGENTTASFKIYSIDLYDTKPKWEESTNGSINGGNTCIAGEEYYLYPEIFSKIQTKGYSDGTYYKLVKSNQNIIVSNNAGEYSAGDVFFMNPEAQPPAVENPETQESGEILVGTTLPEIAQEASLETTLLEIVGLIPIIAVFLVSFLGLKKALQLLSTLLRQS